MKSSNTTNLILSIMACAVLAACGGGSSSSSSSSPDTDTATGASTNISSSGGTLLSSNSNLETYDLIADIGDTWQLVLDKAQNKFTLSIVQSAYGLVNTGNGVHTEGTFAQKSTSGTRTTYTLTPTGGAATELTTDSSTKTIAGNLKVGGLNATVSGTAYKATDLSKLAGVYNFIQAAHDTKGTATSISRSTMAGQINISTDGTLGTACVNGIFSNNTCTAIDGNTPETRTFKLSLNSEGRMVIKQSDDTDFGIATILASNFGKALIIDQRNINQENYARTGTWYLAEAKTLSSTAFDGQWRCAGQGLNNNTITVTGGTGKATNLSTNSTLDAIFKYDQVSTSTGLKNVAGFMSGGASTDAVSTYTLFLPLSSTMAINELGGDQLIRVCYKTSNN
jgi:hypothetical protein